MILFFPYMIYIMKVTLNGLPVGQLIHLLVIPDYV